MNLVGMYHSPFPGVAMGIVDAPHIQQGHMELSARDAATVEGKMACALGRIRNHAAMARETGVNAGLRPAALVLNAYIKWGREYPRHIEGAVTTAVFDAAEDILIVSRDRMGERPVYYTTCPVAFSDHPDALLAARAAEPLVTWEGIGEILGLGPAMTPGKTPLRDIRALGPGEMLVADASGVRVSTYWTLTAEEHGDAPERTVGSVREILERAVNDIVPLHPAAMLSGGLDSTCLTAMLARRIGRPQSFSVDYEGSEEDDVPTSLRPARDAPYAKFASMSLGTIHESVMLTQSALADNLGRAVDERGFPGMADVDASLLLFARHIAPHSRYAVTGECGDEMFGGYPWFEDDFPMEGKVFPWGGSIAARQEMLADGLRREINLAAYARDAWDGAVSSCPRLPGESMEERRKREMQYACFRFFMPNLQLRAIAMCEAGGVTPLAPFADDRLAQYVFNVPWKIKRLGGAPKGLLRAAMTDLLPAPLLNRKKSPYPKTCSPIYAARVRDMARSVLEDRESPLFAIVSRDAFANLVASDLSPADWPWFGQLMAGPQLLAYLWQVDYWMRGRNIRVDR